VILGGFCSAGRRDQLPRLARRRSKLARGRDLVGVGVQIHRWPLEDRGGRHHAPALDAGVDRRSPLLPACPDGRDCVPLDGGHSVACESGGFVHRVGG
jgi:hypothetical protein